MKLLNEQCSFLVYLYNRTIGIHPSPKRSLNSFLGNALICEFEDGFRLSACTETFFLFLEIYSRVGYVDSGQKDPTILYWNCIGQSCHFDLMSQEVNFEIGGPNDEAQIPINIFRFSNRLSLQLQIFTKNQ